jgi:hypothetical protein
MLKQRFYNLGKTLEPYGCKLCLIDEETPDFRNKMLA